MKLPKIPNDNISTVTRYTNYLATKRKHYFKHLKQENQHRTFKKLRNS